VHAFKRAGIVERTARGIDTIFFEQLRNGRPAPSYERSSETDVILVLPGGKANQDFVRLVVEENQAGRPFRLDDLLLLNQLWRERHLAVSEAASVIQKPIAEARRILERLTESGIVDARGEGKNRSYQFSAHTYKRRGQEARICATARL
jgi:ATP-dependent DNA helicase RecG